MTTEVAPRIYETPDIPRVLAVNVAVFCRQCRHWIEGNAYWTIRQIAYMHVDGGCGNRGWYLDDMLEQIAAGH